MSNHIQQTFVKCSHGVVQLTRSNPNIKFIKFLICSAFLWTSGCTNDNAVDNSSTITTLPTTTNQVTPSPLSNSDSELFRQTVAILETSHNPLSTQKLRLMTGSKAAENAYPFYTSLKYGGNYASHLCGATLIAPQWVLTAAHCNVMKLDRLGIVIGERQKPIIEPQDVFRKATAFINHPQYKGGQINNWANDIALIRLDQPVSTIEPVALPTANITESIPNRTPTTVIGLGKNITNQAPSTLMQTHLPLLQNAACQIEGQRLQRIEFLALNAIPISIKNIIIQTLGEKAKPLLDPKKDYTLPPKTICLSRLPIQGVGWGDSGGPLLHQPDPVRYPRLWQQLGVVSYQGIITPAVLSSTGHFKDWIDCVIHRNSDINSPIDNCATPALPLAVNTLDEAESIGNGGGVQKNKLLTK